MRCVACATPASSVHRSNQGLDGFIESTNPSGGDREVETQRLDVAEALQQCRLFEVGQDLDLKPELV